MSTIPKPTAILEEAEKRFPSKGRFDLLRKQGFIDGAMYAATTPTDGREELEKENERLRFGIKHFVEWMEKHRPNISGLGAPTHILKELLNK